VVDVLDVGDYRSNQAVGLRVQRVARVFMKVRSAQQAILQFALRVSSPVQDFLRLQVGSLFTMTSAEMVPW